MDIWKGATLALRFILELCALAALGYWGFRTGAGWIVRAVLGIAAPLAAAVLWGLFVSPKAAYDIGGAGRLAVEIVVFGAAAAALYASGQTKLCALFVAAAVVCRIMLAVLKA